MAVKYVSETYLTIIFCAIGKGQNGLVELESSQLVSDVFTRFENLHLQPTFSEAKRHNLNNCCSIRIIS